MITLEKLLDKHIRIDKKEFTVTIGQDEYKCTKLPFKQLLDIDDHYDVNTQKGAFERNLEVIYLTCPIFREVAAKLDISGDPHNVVVELLAPAEIIAFYGAILNEYNAPVVEDVDAIKKS